MRKAGLDIDKQQGGGRVTLAKACDVSRSTVTRWLEGRSMPGPEHFETIAEAVGVPVVELLTGAGIVSAESLDLVKNRPATLPTPEEAAVALGIRPDDRELFLNFVSQLQKRAAKAQQ